MATELTRRSDKGPHREGWFVYFGDVRVGHIGLRTGVPLSEPQWGWTCGFYPGCDPGQHTNGTGDTFEEARAEFEEAWNRLRQTRTEAHFELYRRDRDWHAWKYRMQDERLPMPAQHKNLRARCFGAAASDSHSGEPCINGGYAQRAAFLVCSGAQRPRLSSPLSGILPCSFAGNVCGGFALTGCAAQRDFRGTPRMAPAHHSPSWGHFSHQGPNRKD